MAAPPVVIGVLSDTHGLLRPEVLSLLEGSDHILHLGDVGDPEILGKLAALAPVTAIRGNIDIHGPCARLPETEVVTLAGRNLYLLHDIVRLDLAPAAAGFSAVLYGHSHRPEIRWSNNRSGQEEILYFNPGSCGPRRFQLPITCGRITLNENEPLKAEILPIFP